MGRQAALLARQDDLDFRVEQVVCGRGWSDEGRESNLPFTADR